MADVFNSKHSCANIEEILDSAGLVSSAEDETYVMKQVDKEGNLLVGFKENGEIHIPKGLGDDSYTLLKSMCEKMAGMNDYMKALPTSSGGGGSEDNGLITSEKDDVYVIKLVDASGNLLQGFTESGEIDAPNGITDGAYQAISSLIAKVKELSDFCVVVKNTIF